MLKYHDKVNALFERKAKDKIFHPGDLVLRWDVIREDKGKHEKFDPLWFGPFKIVEAKGNNIFLLENLDGEVFELPVKGQYLKHYFQY